MNQVMYARLKRGVLDFIYESIRKTESGNAEKVTFSQFNYHDTQLI